MLDNQVYEHDNGSFTFMFGEDEYEYCDPMTNDDWEEWLENGQ